MGSSIPIKNIQEINCIKDLYRQKNQISELLMFTLAINIIAELGLRNKYSVASWRKTFAYHYYHKYKDLSYLQWLFNQTNINMALKFIDEDENMNLRYRDGISL